MSLINCKKCGVLFTKRLRDLCESCVKAENRKIDLVMEFVENTKESFLSIKLISENTGIEMQEVEKLYRTGRLSGISSRITMKCKKCGHEVKGNSKKGFFCPECCEDILIMINKVPESPKSRSSMHIRHEPVKFGFKKDY